uniref:Uncharacterized protein n=1 Tax=Arundo donax TaxID=35708 RepID=A0A0A9CI25_ARUDO
MVRKKGSVSWTMVPVGSFP